MALTTEQIYGLRVRSGMDAFRSMKEHWQAKDDDATYHFARAIEAEVRKQDTELIRQLVKALEKIDAAMPFPVVQQAIKAARARMSPSTAAPRS